MIFSFFSIFNGVFKDDMLPGLLLEKNFSFLLLITIYYKLIVSERSPANSRKFFKILSCPMNSALTAVLIIKSKNFTLY